MSKPESSETLAPMGVTQFADLLGVAQSTVSAWIAEGMPHETAGRGRRATVELAKALPWVVKRNVSGNSQRERLAAEQADRVALKNAQVRGELILRGHVQHVVLEANAMLAGQLEGVAGRFANELASISDPAKVRGILLDEHRRIRRAYADALGKLAASDPPRDEAA